MARPRLHSTVQKPPRVRGFIPLGYYGSKSEPVILNIEEYEAIRLLDYHGLSQLDASKVMEVSRPTLTRIYDRARKKIAKALNEALQILIEGGKAIYNSDWYECLSCGSHFYYAEQPDRTTKCLLCHHSDIKQVKN